MDVFRSYRHTNHNFTVYVGPNQMGFSKISNISEEQEFEPLVEGGLNDSVHYLMSPKQKRETLVMERGVAAVNPLLRQGQLAIEQALGFYLGGRILLPIIIVVKTEDSLTALDKKKMYSISEGVVTRWDIGEFDALNGTLLIEKFEIAHTGLTEVL